MNEKDSKLIWRAINWNGTFDRILKTQPSDDGQANYFKTLFETRVTDNLDINTQPSTYIPILDDPITELEVENGIKIIKSNKAAGIDGVSPSVLKFLNESCIICLTVILSIIFYGVYPIFWTMTRLFTVFKGGDPMNPGNYRGINIMSTFPKLYDNILTMRLQQWFTHDIEQAGAQKGRNCEEQIPALRLLIDIATKEKKKLYVLFVNFEKSYDKVSRATLMTFLKNMGCGSAMIQALKNSLKKTTSLFSGIEIDTTSGVRQEVLVHVFCSQLM